MVEGRGQSVRGSIFFQSLISQPEDDDDHPLSFIFHPAEVSSFRELF